MEFAEKQAIYLQIANRVCEFILSKKWDEDQRIPSVREIAMLMEVNPNTAFRAYDYLQSKEILYNKRGIGYFVAPNGYEKTIEFKKNEFLEVDVPQFFKTMKLLGLSYKELEDYINKNNI